MNEPDDLDAAANMAAYLEDRAVDPEFADMIAAAVEQPPTENPIRHRGDGQMAT